MSKIDEIIINTDSDLIIIKQNKDKLHLTHGEALDLANRMLYIIKEELIKNK
jgi:hypothetical protein